MRLLSAGEVCDVLSTPSQRFPYQTLNSWVRNDIIRPVVQARGTGHHRMFSIVDVLAVAMGRGLRANGFTLKAAGAVTETLMNFNEDQLRRSFTRGRTFLVVTGETVQAKLVTREEVTEQAFGRRKAGEGIGLLPIALDVQHLYENICAKIDRQDTQATKKPKRRRSKRSLQKSVAKTKAAKRKKVKS